MKNQINKTNTIKPGFLKITQGKITKFFGMLGTGFVTGSADDDPSGIGTYSIAGAQYGLLLAWLMPFLLPLMFVVQEMCARIGMVTGKGLTANMKRIFPKPLIFFAILILFFANVANIGANIAIMSESVRLLVDINVTVIALLIAAIIIIVEILVPYHLYSKVLTGLALSLLAYIATAFIVTEHWLDVIKSIFIPHIQYNKTFALVVAGVIGTTISPYLFFWQTSQEVEESMEQGLKGFSGRYKKRLHDAKQGTFFGMFFSQLIALFIIITCFATLHKNGITEIQSAHDAAMALKPLAGEWASLIFTLGIIGAGFLAIPVLAGSTAYALAEMFNHREGLLHKFSAAPFFYGVITLSILTGLAINFIGINPMKALLFSAIINCIGAVPLLAFVIILANKKNIMGGKTNGYFSNILGWLTFAIMFAASTLVLVYTWA